MLYRILMRLAGAWIVLIGGCCLADAIVAGAQFDRGDVSMSIIFTGVPALLLCALAWVVKPREE